MKKLAFLFPGQGSQAPGMGRDAVTIRPASGDLFDEADAVMGFSLRELCFNGTEEALKQTDITQPALYVSSAATLAILTDAGIRPHAVAGHSLGEYTALLAAGVYDFGTGLRLVRQRGQAFADIGRKDAGAMAAVMGLDAARVEAICAEAGAKGIVVPANYNEPSQTVISGDPAAVDAACELAKAAGAKRALRLPVSGAFHSPLMAPAAAVMREALGREDFRRPECLFVNNVDAALLDDPAAIRESLLRQVTGSVRWTQSVERLAGLGIEAFVEVGSGKVLSGLARRIAKDIPVYTTESADAIKKVLAELAP